jgi:hypothetical protein
MANLVCRKCRGTDVSSETGTRKRLWAVVLGAILLAVGAIVLVSWGTVASPVLIVTVIPGFALLTFGFRRDPVYSYTCKSCGNTWRRSAKTGPEEGDSRYTDWQIWRLSLDNLEVQTQAATWLGEHRAASAVEPLIQCLGVRKIAYRDVRIAAAWALKEIGDERAVQPLIDVATDTGWAYTEVRATAISALSAFEHPEIRKILEAASNDKDFKVRKAASESLAARSRAA